MAILFWVVLAVALVSAALGGFLVVSRFHGEGIVSAHRSQHSAGEGGRAPWLFTILPGVVLVICGVTLAGIGMLGLLPVGSGRTEALAALGDALTVIAVLAAAVTVFIARATLQEAGKTTKATIDAIRAIDRSTRVLTQLLNTSDRGRLEEHLSFRVNHLNETSNAVKVAQAGLARWKDSGDPTLWENARLFLFGELGAFPLRELEATRAATQPGDANEVDDRLTAAAHEIREALVQALDDLRVLQAQKDDVP
jgi:hypothetical protein